MTFPRPVIHKCSRIAGNKLVLRDARQEDAFNIFKLRTDIARSRYLSLVGPTVEDQISWLCAYAESKEQAYFIIEDLSGTFCGTVRMYDPQGLSFCWGSWVLKQDCPRGYAHESALIVYSYAIHLGFSSSHFDVRKDNKSVWKFHEGFGATRVGCDSDNFYYRISSAAIKLSLKRYLKFLPSGIVLPGANLGGIE